MNIYVLDDSANISYFSDKSDVALAAHQVAPSLVVDALVKLVDVPTSKASILRILAGYQPMYDVIKVWRLSSRRALIEVPSEQWAAEGEAS